MSEAKKSIVIKANFEATHAWETCDIKEVEFLRYPHRHIFYVVVKIYVNHDDRDLEFFVVKAVLNKILDKYRNNYLKNMSCEMLCDNIYQSLSAEYDGVHFVSVYEDNENGVEYVI